MTKSPSKKLNNSGISRREALLGLGGGFTLLGGCAITQKVADIDAVFTSGVASGDPTGTSMVIWTRAYNPDVVAVPVGFEVAEDAEFSRIVRKGTGLAATARDYTLKVDIESLSAGSRYFYRFRAGQAVSDIGQFRTLPDKSGQKVRLAVASCANFGSGFYNAYRTIAETPGIDAVIHLGDYIYEYGPDGYDGETGRMLGRFAEPAHDAVTLEDYRARFAAYRRDPDLQAAHAAAAFITVWDDHETANNSWMGGAANHKEDKQGSWAARCEAALQAYFEWMPMRDPKRGEAARTLTRTYEFGEIASLILIESRLTGRGEALSLGGVTDPEAFEAGPLADPARTMLGAPQEAWLDGELKRSAAAGTAWQVLGNQTVMAPMRTPDYTALLPEDILEAVRQKGGYSARWVERSKLGLPVNLDAWDGYPAARERLLSSAISAQANLVVLSGDSHMFWASDLYRQSDERFAGVEFATGSITSPGGYENITSDPRIFEIAASAIPAKNRGVRFANVKDKGFVLLTLTRKAAQAEYIGMSTVRSRDYEARTLVVARADRGKSGRAGELTLSAG
ncbi:alkaline phosphatase [Hyphomonas polymorpha PS728]|uniref:Alkaline phosphatase n=1 Tax=Hyphomonas polymorpha PS728 TaxID=1280954 RepID=A0A062V9C2_9PROT|nr:alkaline phosphatase D family protein [Hyphomonas polymorpha]KCZ98845.1 alkaline phosphatase [Hyphomonas polymorpha PS728]